MPKTMTKTMSRARLSDLIAEPLAIDLRYVPQLIGDIKAEAAAVLVEYEPPPISTLIDAKGQPLAADDPMSGRRPGSLTAVVPLVGVVMRHSYYRAGTAEIGRHLMQLDADDSVGSIVLDVNSPGGSVYGTEELADIVRGIRTRGQTHISAAVDPLMASAATWIATAANEVVSIPSADVGSIGVITIYADMSRLYANEGVDITVVRRPDKKARFTGVEPLSDDMRAEMEARNLDAYNRFVDAMAVNRGVDRDAVATKFGGGEVMRGRDAIGVGLIDRIASLDQIISERVAIASQPDPRVAKHRRQAAASMIQ